MSPFSSVAVRASSGMSLHHSADVSRSSRARRSAVTVAGFPGSNSGNRRGGTGGGSGRNDSEIFRCRGSSRGDRGVEMHRRSEEAEEVEAGEASSSSGAEAWFGGLRRSKGRVVGALTAAVVAGCFAGGADTAALAEALGPAVNAGVNAGDDLTREIKRDVRLLERELQIDAELIQREEERVPLTFETFVEREPPVLVGFLALLCANGAVGLTWALFFRETSVGAGGEVGKGIVALRKEIVKGILKFFGSIMGSYVSRQGKGTRRGG
uniref:Uncharacterized protein n=1 Tax=Mantoniella antarctica TaxID=81844 RepID=A0A7S0T1K2_9CHLO|mmetsp:Transcript_4000/g.9707  ORF Transcript_4000/g.9707 Transcript_4000/m.9707 type:complete len:267 (+) Transcript_4000:221-1021(+)